MNTLTHWLDGRMTIFGSRLTVIGTVLLVASFASNVVFQWLYGSQVSDIVGHLIMTLAFTYNIATTMIWAGIPLYCVGRLLEAGPFTFVGFEKASPSDIVIKGPDETHTVWIGRAYSSAHDAEVAAVMYRKRLGLA